MKRTKMLKRTIRYREDQLEFLQAKAKKAGMKGVGTYVRMLISDCMLTQAQRQ